MGLYPGVEVRVIQGFQSGSLLVARGETRLGVGIGMAHKIFVQSVKERGESDGGDYRGPCRKPKFWKNHNI